MLFGLTSVQLQYVPGGIPLLRMLFLGKEPGYAGAFPFEGYDGEFMLGTLGGKKG